MPGNTEIERASPASLVPMAVIIASVLVLALAVSGVLWKTTTGTIVVQTMRLGVTNNQSPHGGANDGTDQKTTQQISFTTITETSASGNEQRVLITESLTQPGFQQVSAGNSMQIYDPTDDTIYMTTQNAWQAAVNRQMQQSAPKGSHVSSSSMSFSYAGNGYVPGRTSVFEQQLRRHLYRLAGRTTIDGRPALVLAPVHRAVQVSHSSHGSASELFGTVYLSPRTYYPIREVVRAPFQAGLSTTNITDWSVYKVLPATSANRRLLSLTARHPHAHIVHSAAAFITAQTLASKRL